MYRKNTADAVYVSMVITRLYGCMRGFYLYRLCMYDHSIKQIGDKPVGMVANPARGQLNRQNIFTMSLFASETFV